FPTRRSSDLKQWQGPQLVARPGNGLRLVQTVDALHLELANHGQAEKRNRGADARDHGVHRADRLSLVKESVAAPAHANVKLKRIQHAHLMAPMPCRLGQAA